jgi:hypothetical protein
MAKARLAIVPKRAEPATEAKPAPQVELPDSVWDVLIRIQARLYQLRGIVAGIHALAEANDDTGDARWAMEAALPMFDSIIDSVDPTMVRRAAAQREVRDGR